MRGLLGAIACVALLAGAVEARAEFPEKPVKLINAYAAGGAVDVIARLLAAKLNERWKNPMVVVNMPGAGGTLAAENVAHLPPDGYNLVFTTNGHTVTPYQFPISYDPLKSFAPVTLVASGPSFLVISPSLAEVNSVKDLIALAKAKPGSLNYSTGGQDVLYWQLFKNEAGVDMQNVPYGGGAPAQTAVLANEVQMTLAAGRGAVELVKGGKLKAIAVTGKARSPLLPDVPTVAESSGLPEFSHGTENGNWFGILAPAGTPSAVVHKLRDDIAEVMKLPDVQDKLNAQTFISVANTPEEFTKIIAEDLARWGEVTKSMPLK